MQPSRNHIIYKLPFLTQTYIFNHNVLRFDVPMDNAVAMEKRNSLKDIPQNLHDLVLLELFFLSHEVEKVVSRAILHNEIDIVNILKQSIKFNDVGVIEVHLNFHLSQKRGL